MDHADEEDDSEIFIYRGGRAPQHVTHVLIDKSLDEIEENAFYRCEHLLTVETHDGLRRVGKKAFCWCKSLRRIDLKSVLEIEDNAFECCERLLQVDTHDGLRKIGKYVFRYCKSLPRINLKSVVEIGDQAFYECKNLESVEFGDRLETIEWSAFKGCFSLSISSYHRSSPSENLHLMIVHGWQMLSYRNDLKQLGHVHSVSVGFNVLPCH
jgi:hypothetical protein